MAPLFATVIFQSASAQDLTRLEDFEPPAVVRVRARRKGPLRVYRCKRINGRQSRALILSDDYFDDSEDDSGDAWRLKFESSSNYAAPAISTLSFGRRASDNCRLRLLFP